MKTRIGIIVGIVVLCSLVAVAYFRSGLLSLPSVPENVSAHAAGLEHLDAMKSTDESVASEVTAPDPLVASLQLALKEIRGGNEEQGFHAIQEIVRNNPANLVIGNVLRMEALRLKQKWLASNADKSEIALVFPEYLNDEPIRFYRGLAKANPSREVKLQLALALVDHMLLFPALEIKAPSSVEAVEVLTDIIEHGNADGAYYVPALYARGLNYLYRPFNLVWPEKIAAPRDARASLPRWQPPRCVPSVGAGCRAGATRARGAGGCSCGMPGDWILDGQDRRDLQGAAGEVRGHETRAQIGRR